MAEISLKEYLEKVDALLKTGKSDEVILHSRQILKHYPKNVAASRYLGQALVRGSGYKEAEPVLRRVLSVYPDDVIAHAGLSEMDDRQGKGDEAIWHIERALEGTPNDSALIDRWRSLYQRYRKVEDPRFQLTTGAVARQYTRNGLYAQAIETLQTTLEKSPRRVDLRLLLAQTMWNAGMQVEGAETALDVLDVLPYCLEANRILTLLWLSEGRPSDAQRYLNQIQEVEPYQALQLAQNASPDDDAFTLPELDYRRIAESQINTNQPNWLTEIDEDAPAAEPVSLDTAQASDLEDELPEAFLTDLEADDAPVVTRPKTGMTGLLAALDQPQNVAEEETTDDDLPESGELPDWLMESAPQEAALAAQAVDEVEDDPLAWLEDGGTELADEQPDPALDFAAVQEQTGKLDWLEQPSEDSVPDFFGNDDFDAARPPTDTLEEHDPLAWLQGSGVELIDESDMPPVSSLIDEEEMVYSDPEQINPLAWLESSGVELVAADDTLSAMFEQPPTSSAEPVSSLEDESPDLFAEIPQTISEPENDEDALDWLEAADSDEPSVTGLLRNLPPSSGEDSLDWLHDDSILDEVLNVEALSDTGSLSPAASPDPEEEQAVPDLFADLDRVTDQLPGSISEIEFTGTDRQNNMAENEELEPQSDDSELGSFEWLNEEPEAEDSTQASASDLDWMTEVPEEEPDWLNEENGEIESASPAASSPDWLVEESGSVTNEFGWLDEPGDEFEPISEVPASSEALDWLSGSDEGEEEATAEPGEMPDWLSAVAPAEEDAEDAEVASAIAGDEEEVGWLGGENASAAVTDSPDWLSAIAPVSEEDDSEPAAEMAEMPDWLASSKPSDPDESELESEIVSEAEVEAFDWSEEEPQAEPAGEMPDWLSAIAPAGEDDAEMASEIETSFDALEMEAEPAAEMAEMPDWLASSQPSDSDESELESETEAEAFDWSEEEPEAEPAGEMPDWLSAIAPAGEDDAEMASEIEASLDALEMEAEAEEAEPAAELAAMPDWLASSQPSDSDEGELESEIVSEGEIEAFDWSEEEPEAEPAGEMPDWLSAIAPAGEDDVEMASEIEASLDALEMEAEAEEAEPAAELAAMPDWLASVQPSDSDEGELESDFVSEAESYEWSEQESEAEPISDLPDWLADAEPESGRDAGQPLPPAAMIAQTRILPENDFGWPDDENTEAEEPEYETDYEANPAHSQFGWTGEPEAEAEELGEYAASAESIASDEEDIDFEEKVLASAATPPPADNAPDWLNAMVPGLDLDYQAIEDDRPIESEYINIPARREQLEIGDTTQPDNLNWLVDIVDEETGPMRAVQDSESARTRSRFTFSRQPAWLRTLLAQRGRTGSQPDDDFELPEWLR